MEEGFVAQDDMGASDRIEREHDEEVGPLLCLLRALRGKGWCTARR